MSGPVVGAALGLAVGAAAVLLLAAWGSPPERRAVRRASRGRAVTGRRVAASVLAAVVGAVLALVATGLPVAGVLGACAGATLPAVVLHRRAGRRRRALAAAWPEAVDTLHSGIRAGLALPEALVTLGAAGPVVLRPAFRAFAVEHRATGSLAAALAALQAHLADPVADRVVAALRLTDAVGGRELGTLLRTLSAMLREESRIRAEIEARQSWTVSAARLAVAAPWITLVLLCTRPEAVAAYLTPAGGLVIATAAVLSTLAYALMRRIGRLPGDGRVAA